MMADETTTNIFTVVATTMSQSVRHRQCGILWVGLERDLLLLLTGRHKMLHKWRFASPRAEDVLGVGDSLIRLNASYLRIWAVENILDEPHQLLHRIITLSILDVPPIFACNEEI